MLQNVDQTQAHTHSGHKWSHTMETLSEHCHFLQNYLLHNKKAGAIPSYGWKKCHVIAGN